MDLSRCTQLSTFLQTTDRVFFVHTRDVYCCKVTHEGLSQKGSRTLLLLHTPNTPKEMNQDQRQFTKKERSKCRLDFYSLPKANTTQRKRGSQHGPVEPCGAITHSSNPGGCQRGTISLPGASARSHSPTARVRVHRSCRCTSAMAPSSCVSLPTDDRSSHLYLPSPPLLRLPSLALYLPSPPLLRIPSTPLHPHAHTHAAMSTQQHSRLHFDMSSTRVSPTSLVDPAASTMVEVSSDSKVFAPLCQWLEKNATSAHSEGETSTDCGSFKLVASNPSRSALDRLLKKQPKKSSLSLGLGTFVFS